MKKANKILMAIVAILLALVMISTSVLSSVFAKYVTTQNTKALLNLKKFGVTVEVITDSTKLPAGAEITYPENKDALEKAGVYSVTIENLPIYPGVGEIDNAEIYKHLVRFNFSGTANVPVQVGISTDIDLNGFNTTIPTGADTSVTYFPLGFSCFAYDNAGNQVGSEYTMASSGVTSGADVESRENKIAENFQGKFDFTNSGNLAFKEFGTNANNKTIAFKTKVDDTTTDVNEKNIAINTFDLGLFWAYSATTTKNKYDTWLGQNNEGAAISVTFTVRVEQIDQ